MPHPARGVVASMIAMAVASSIAAAPAPSGGAAKSGADGKLNVAVMVLKNSSGISEGEAGLITDRLRGELFNTGRANVMEREQMQEILKEQGFQQSGSCTDQACLVQMGQLLGVQAIISGSMGKLGNMYLVNLRIIDVQTGRIVQVVSEDIKGELEEVVGRLPGIAARLVGMSAPPPKKPEAEAPVVETPKEEPRQSTPEPQKAAPVQPPAPAPVIDEREERNRNRGGLRVFFELYPGKIAKQFQDSYDGSWYNATDMDSLAGIWRSLGYTANVTQTPTMNFGVKFGIRAGKYITIDVGPAFTFAHEEFTLSSSVNNFHIDENWFYFVPHVALGVNFVKRWYPFKLNAGIMADANFNVVTYSYDSLDSYYSDTSNRTDANFAFNVTFGPRVGGEILVGKHIGFNIDLFYKFLTTIEASLNYAGSAGTPTPTRFTFPGFGLGVGFNAYF